MELHLRDVSRTYPEGLQAPKDKILTIPPGVYGPQMKQAFRDLRRESLRRGGIWPARFRVRVGLDPASPSPSREAKLRR